MRLIYPKVGDFAVRVTERDGEIQAVAIWEWAEDKTVTPEQPKDYVVENREVRVSFLLLGCLLCAMGVIGLAVYLAN